MKNKQKVIFIDIDETICFNLDTDVDSPRDYSQAVPNRENITKANKLYDEGNKIVYWTARGSLTGEDWTETTTSQLTEWEVKYHELRLGKPHYDILFPSSYNLSCLS